MTQLSHNAQLFKLILQNYIFRASCFQEPDSDIKKKSLIFEILTYWQMSRNSLPQEWPLYVSTAQNSLLSEKEE